MLGAVAVVQVSPSRRQRWAWWAWDEDDREQEGGTGRLPRAWVPSRSVVFLSSSVMSRVSQLFWLLVRCDQPARYVPATRDDEHGPPTPTLRFQASLAQAVSAPQEIPDAPESNDLIELCISPWIPLPHTSGRCQAK